MLYVVNVILYYYKVLFLLVKQVLSSITDLQEYMGSFVTDIDGKLKFQEGVLVQAVRNGYWIILDELNVAPSEVQEASNRELYIPETQETVKPHPNFLLFATQNPAGIYG